MKRNKGMQLCAVLAVMLIMNIAFVPTVSMATTDQKINDQGTTHEEQKQLEKLQTTSKKEMENSIKKSLEKSQKELPINNGEISINTCTDVPLGTDTTFTTADWGNNDNGGLGTGNSDAHFYTSERKAEATSRATPGYSSEWGWTQIGKEFYVSGTGGQQADIKMPGWIKTSSGNILAASSEMTVTAILWDGTTGQVKNTQQIYHWSSSAKPWYENKDKSFSSTQNVYLESGHYYTMYLQVETSASSLLTGEGWADALTDRDLPDTQFKGYVKYNSISIDFK
ncbi:MAG: hypothetical protein K0A89_05950 [ANME-2 cluster archaeon]|nr:hypothetical protein [ANME-2 cluster archaeon]